ncbi:MAG: inorganic phosphate transporter [Planctomycetia bacterium]|nr:inorganic phosphate transporter [Planctomycetia bacterium]
MNFWDAALSLSAGSLIFLAIALLVAFAFEFINGFHDTANAVTTVIYTRSLQPTPAVLYSGFLNFMGVLLGGTAVAFGIVNLLPVDLLIEGTSNAALVMVLSLLLAGVIWNLGTWYRGLPVSSSHTLIGSILGVGIANSLYSGQGMRGVNWEKAGEVGLALLVSPLVGFTLAALLLLGLKVIFKSPRLYTPPQGADRPPGWIRGTLIATCGGVSFAHGSNDGQKGMGLILLVLIGFLPFHYAVNTAQPQLAAEVLTATGAIEETLTKEGHELPGEAKRDLANIRLALDGKKSLAEVPEADRWTVRQSIFRFRKFAASVPVSDDTRKALKPHLEALSRSVEFVPLWVVICTALALGIGTTIGYKRIVITVAEKIGKTPLTFAQGAAAETVAAGTILLAAMTGLPVSTTHVLSSGVAGTMVANKSGVQGGTCKKILLAWVLTLPACILLAGGLFWLGRLIAG